MAIAYQEMYLTERKSHCREQRNPWVSEVLSECVS